MPNIILNQTCNRRCVYCFAGTEKSPAPEMTLDNLTMACDFLERSFCRKINVLGGEPSLHSQFSLFMDYLFARRFAVHVFTNGVMPAEALAGLRQIIALRRLTPHRLKFVVNVNEEKYCSAGEMAAQKLTLSALNAFCSLSFNIFESSCSLDFLPELIREFNLIPELRIGMAAPVMGGGNRFLDISSFPAIAAKIVAFSHRLQDQGVDLVLDCGFPLCLFSDAQLGKLYRHKTQLKFICRAIPDIDPELNVYHCYPLSGYYPRRLTEFRDLEEIRGYFAALLSHDQGGAGIFPACAKCVHRRRGMCAGGCRGHYISGSSRAGTPAERDHSVNREDAAAGAFLNNAVFPFTVR